MDRVQSEAPSGMQKTKLLRPWLAWVSSAAAILVIGWIGIQAWYLKPLQESRLQESISLMVDYYGEELHEGELAGFIEDNQIYMNIPRSEDVMEVIQIEPDMTEEYIYESVGF